LEKEVASSSRPMPLWQRGGAMRSLQEAMGLADEKEKTKTKESLKKRPAAKSEKNPAKRRFWKKHFSRRKQTKTQGIPARLL